MRPPSLVALALVLVAAVASAAETQERTLSGSFRYSIDGDRGGKRVRADLKDVTSFAVTQHDGHLAQRVRLRLIDGRSIELGRPQLAMGGNWFDLSRKYDYNARGEAVTDLAAAATHEGLANFLRQGDAALDWTDVSKARLTAAALRRLDAAIDRSHTRRGEAELRKAIARVRDVADDLDALNLADAAEIHLGERAYADEAVVELDPAERTPSPELEGKPRSHPRPQTQPQPVRAGTPREELLIARAEVIALLQEGEAPGPEELGPAMDRYRAAGGTLAGIRAVDRKLVARLRRLESEHRRQVLARPFAGVPEALAPFVSRDLTRLAARGKLDPVVGRDREVRRVMQALNRRTKRNVFLTGEPGVGKTALVEALAMKSARGDLDVPDGLRGKPIVELSMSSLVAGSKYRGELEERLKSMLDELAKMPDAERPILFIDEGHTLIGGGAAEGGLDVGNILKPALARGDIQLISATTSDEYDRFVGKDKALGRRFSPVFVPEPSPAAAVRMLRARVPDNERHYNVKIDRSAVRAAVDLSVRYLPTRTLPDKSQDVLEEAASRVSARRRGRVTAGDVRHVVEEWSGVPIRTGRAEVQMLLDLEKRLGQRVFGQDHAIAELADAYRELRAKMKTGHNRRPANLLFLGPTGVGKTELTRAFAADAFGDEEAVTRIDMSEYQERHSVSRLIGSPPGYVDSDKQGKLTEAVRRRPFQVLVLDEFEKAHPDVQKIFLQVLEDGRLTDGHGTVDFRNTVIVMTSNALTELPRAKAKLGFDAGGDDGGADDADVDQKAVRDALVRGGMLPELVNRIDRPVMFRSLAREALASIVRKMLGDEGRQYGVKLRATPAAEKELARRGHNPSMGARPLRRAVQKAASPVARRILVDGPGREYLMDAKDGRLTIGPLAARSAPRDGVVNPKLRKRLEAKRARR